MSLAERLLDAAARIEQIENCTTGAANKQALLDFIEDTLPAVNAANNFLWNTHSEVNRMTDADF